MIASLPMYHRSETRAAHGRMWDLIRKHLGYGPSQLTYGIEGIEHWLDPNLLISQTCGMPYRLYLHGKVRLVGAPVWDLDHERDGYYHSVIIARKDSAIESLMDCIGRRLAVNMGISQSGWAAPQNMAMEHGFSFTDVLETGAHVASARAVAEGAADIAALDIVTWMLIGTHDKSFSHDLKVVCRTPSTPALPYITSMAQEADAIFEATKSAIRDLSDTDRDTLKLRGITRISAEDYLSVPSPAFPKVTSA